MYRDDIERFAKTDKELEAVIKTIRIYIQDIGMEITMEKRVISIMKSGERETTELIEQPNKERIRTLGREGKLQILEYIANTDHHTSRTEIYIYIYIYI